MVLQIEDCVDCLLHMCPQLGYEFELDHLSGHNVEQPDRLSSTSSVINLGWGGKQGKMRSKTNLVKTQVYRCVYGVMEYQKN